MARLSGRGSARAGDCSEAGPPPTLIGPNPTAQQDLSTNRRRTKTCGSPSLGHAATSGDSAWLQPGAEAGGVGRARNRRRVDRAEAARATGRQLRTAGRAALLLAGAAALLLAAREGWRYAPSGAALRIREIRFTGLKSAD